MDPLRLRIVKALCAVIESVVEGSDSPYKHTLTGKVFRGRNVFGDTDPVPMVSVLEAPIPLDQLFSSEEGGASTGEWDLLIQGFCEDDPENPTDPAYSLLADVRAALAAERVSVGLDRRKTGRTTPLLGVTDANGAPAVLDMVVGFGTCRPPDELSAKAYFWLTVTLTVAEDVDKPYG